MIFATVNVLLNFVFILFRALKLIGKNIIRLKKMDNNSQLATKYICRLFVAYVCLKAKVLHLKLSLEIIASQVGNFDKLDKLLDNFKSFN